MKSASVTVKNPTGLHARPASDFCKLAGKMACDVFVEKGDKKVSAKSIIKVLTLGVCKGETVNVITDGEDEENALSQLVTYIENLED